MTPPTGPGLLLCDLDDTVVDRAATFRAWAEEFVAARGLDGDALAWLLAEDRDGYRPRPTLFAMARDRFGLPEPVDELVAAFYADFGRRFRCEPAVGAALRAARDRGWRIALVTNGSAAQESKIRAAGLDALVDAWCISEVEGCRKPDPALLARAAARCGVPLAAGWVVGDAPGPDIGAATAAGIPSAWLHHGREWPRSDYFPTLRAADFPEAVERILERAAAGG